jgi:hypothetical protein
MGLRSIGLPEILVVLTSGFVVFGTVFPACLICKKAGYSPWWGILTLFPPAAIVWIWYLGFANWPVGRREQTTSFNPSRQPEPLR